VGQRRETEKVADRQKTVLVGMSPCSPEKVPIPLSVAGAENPSLGGSQPPPVAIIAIGLGNCTRHDWGEYMWSRQAAVPSYFFF
jgi:hypothetical protein